MFKLDSWSVEAEGWGHNVGPVWRCLFPFCLSVCSCCSTYQLQKGKLSVKAAEREKEVERKCAMESCWGVGVFVNWLSLFWQLMEIKLPCLSLLSFYLSFLPLCTCWPLSHFVFLARTSAGDCCYQLKNWLD